MINCFIINLKRCIKKKTKMIEKMKQYPEINYSFFEAIDGQEINNNFMDKNNYQILESWRDPLNNIKIKLGEIGCSLSHYKIYEKIIESDYDVTLILEDDVEFTSDFFNKLNITLNNLETIKNWDILFLGRKKLTNTIEIVVKNDIHNYSYSYWTIGYLINKNACEKIINSNFIKNIIPIDEFLPLAGNNSNLKKYKNIHNIDLNLYVLQNDIIKPEKNAFKCSDTEISTFLKSNNNKCKLKIITFSIDQNDIVDRFEKSCEIYNLNYKILNYNKSNEYKIKMKLFYEEIIDYNDDDIILFLINCNLIFLSESNEIIEKYNKFDSDIIFSSNSDNLCNKILNKNDNYKYLNKNYFIGNVKTIKEIIINTNTMYDNKYFINIYQNNKNKIKIDLNCNIFQNNYLSICNDITFSNNKINNNIYNTNPSVFTTTNLNNLNIIHNNICNYLNYNWNNTYNYLGKKIITNYDKYIYIFIDINYDKYNSFFYENIENFSYPKKNIILHINTFDKYIKRFLTKFKSYNEYKKIIFTYELRKNNSNINSMDNCLKEKCDYYLFYNYNTCIYYNNIIEELISYNKNIISPLICKKNLMFSNFWGHIDRNGWYSDSFNYNDIILNEHIGCWNCAHISNIYLIKSEIIHDIKDYYDTSQKYKDILFCKKLRNNNFFMYIINNNTYGYILEDSNLSNYKNKNIELKNINIKNYTNNKYLWINKYIDYSFFNKNNITEPIPDVIRFKIFNDTFCSELIDICNNFSNWSGATTIDSRIGKENVPTNDIHLKQLKLHDIWNQFVLDEISPLVSTHWGPFKTTGINISFVVKYDSKIHYKLSPHHDSSSYTLNIALNDDYEGGEVNFISKNKIYKHVKGYGIIHPGKVTHYHEGLTLKKGLKYIFVSFVN